MAKLKMMTDGQQEDEYTPATYLAGVWKSLKKFIFHHIIYLI